MDIKLGMRVKDRITRIQGIAIGITRWMYGCERVTVQPESSKDGKPVDTFCVDMPQLEFVDDGLNKDEVVQERQTPGRGKGGPREDAVRGLDVSR